HTHTHTHTHTYLSVYLLWHQCIIMTCDLMEIEGKMREMESSKNFGTNLGSDTLDRSKVIDVCINMTCGNDVTVNIIYPVCNDDATASYLMPQ
ncbi:MAG: hypothetical protein KTM48_00625, partial [Wolbachia endosymbiont of Pissodes strobi]|nr:hypothetical protein [Wolbachia endosymbiont of Pissodes strobi]